MNNIIIAYCADVYNSLYELDVLVCDKYNGMTINEMFGRIQRWSMSVEKMWKMWLLFACNNPWCAGNVAAVMKEARNNIFMCSQSSATVFRLQLLTIQALSPLCLFKQIIRSLCRASGQFYYNWWTCDRVFPYSNGQRRGLFLWHGPFPVIRHWYLIWYFICEWRCAF